MADGGPAREPVPGSGDGLSGRDLLGLGGMLAGSVIALTAIGYLLDQALDTSPVLTLVGIALGMVAGAVGFWVRVRAALRSTGDSTLRDPGSS
jgi:F0F1-type ATP synthase assembly protein I